MKKTLFPLFVMILLPLMANAEAVEIDGIYYNLVTKGNVAEVTMNPNEYSGSVEIPSSVSYEEIEYTVTSIEDHAFSDCSGLTSITLPNSITNIGNQAFEYCSGLTSITLPNSITSIGDQAFSNCSGLASITLPNSITSIGDRVFSNCSGLTSITLPNSITDIRYGAFSHCSGLTSITLPNSITSIGNGAFYHCSGLASITLPNSITSIGSDAFQGCSGLTSITLGSGVSYIGENAFAYCRELADVYCLAEKVPTTKSDAFKNSYIEYATLHVPASAINDYKAAEPWKGFGTFKTLEGDVVEPQKCATPAISFSDNRLSFSSETDGVEYIYVIKDADVKQGYDSEVQLSATYEISVYATKQGWENSDVATATLVWGSAAFTEATPGSQTSIALPMAAAPALITTRGGIINIQTEADGLPVIVYTIDGQLLGQTKVRDGRATIATTLAEGQVAIVRVGQQSSKLIIR